jgi:small subunit ribosomal protein S8
MTDPIADFLTRLRNAAMVRHLVVTVPYSKMKEAMLKIFVEEGYVERYERENGAGPLSVTLKDIDGAPVLKTIRRISSPGHRVYVKRGRLPRVLNDYGIAIISTSQGIMTNREARKRSLGGEILCELS